MRTFVRQLLTLCFALMLLPGWAELLENVEHLAVDGHLAHLTEHHHQNEEHQSLQDEHGCTPLSHTCACHASVPAIVPSRFKLRSMYGLALRVALPTHHQSIVLRANAPPVPPPRA